MPERSWKIHAWSQEHQPLDGMGQNGWTTAHLRLGPTRVGKSRVESSRMESRRYSTIWRILRLTMMQRVNFEGIEIFPCRRREEASSSRGQLISLKRSLLQADVSPEKEVEDQKTREVPYTNL
jgi:hypothetical protein